MKIEGELKRTSDGTYRLTIELPALPDPEANARRELLEKAVAAVLDGKAPTLGQEPQEPDRHAKINALDQVRQERVEQADAEAERKQLVADEAWRAKVAANPGTFTGNTLMDQ